MEKKLIEKCYEEMLVFLKDNFVEKSGIESLEDENNITDIIHIFTAIRKSEHRDPVKEDEIKQGYKRCGVFVAIFRQRIHRCHQLKRFN